VDEPDPHNPRHGTTTTAPNAARIHDGVLQAWIEMGMEGAVWVLLEDGPGGFYERLRTLEAGDHLTVWLPDGRILFDGAVRTDRRAGWEEYPLNPGHGQPAALGYWAHWTQRDWEPDLWASLFLLHDPPLRARLAKQPAGRLRARAGPVTDGRRIDPAEYAAWVAARVAALQREADERQARWRKEHPEQHAAVLRQMERVRAGEITLDEAFRWLASLAGPGEEPHGAG
jgi:hypothetical protein